MPRYRLQITFDATDDEDACDLVDEAIAPALKLEMSNARNLSVDDVDVLATKTQYTYERTARRGDH
jgi:hypothetical protein